MTSLRWFIVRFAESVAATDPTENVISSLFIFQRTVPIVAATAEKE